MAALGAAWPAGPAAADDAATIAELRRQLQAMQRRLDALEARSAPAPAARPAPPARAAAATPPPSPRAPRQAGPAADSAALAAAAEARSAAAEARAASAEIRQVAEQQAAANAPIPGLDPPDPMGRNFVTEEALRADLPGVSLRIPGTDTQFRFYGFAKVTGWGDFNARNPSDAPPPSTIPLASSPAAQQGGDFGMSGRFSRFGFDTRTLTRWGTLETRLEGDFGGGAPNSPNAVFRLRQAWAEVGSERFRVLSGFANSLWNEGLYETLIDATNLNQSFVRQAQLRLTGRLAPGLTGQFSLETPETNYAAVGGLVNPSSTLAGGASPAINSMPDVLGRLTYRDSGWELGLRGMLRRLRVDTAGTAAAVPAQNVSAMAWGFAGHVRMPMRLLSDWFGPDELVGAAYYGEGIGRYFFGSSGGIDAVSNLGLPGSGGALAVDPVQTWGATLAYRRFWTPGLRSNVSVNWARQDFPAYALQFAPGSASATALNRELQQVFFNLIWSPFAEERNGVVQTGWLDVGVEYLFTRRDIYGGAQATGSAGAGYGIANRILGAVVARFGRHAREAGMSTVDQVLAHVDANLDAALERLFALLRLKSISTDPAFAEDCKACAAWHVADLAAIGFDAKAHATPGHPIVVGHARQGAGRSVLFYGHYDVQPVDPLELWDHDPFAPSLDTLPDGRTVIRARGASDDKGQVMTFVEACRAYKAVTGSLPLPITILLEGEEESGGVNLPPFLKSHAAELKADIGLICDTGMWDATTPAIVTMLRGLCGEEVTIHAAAMDLHSGLFGSAAANPNRILARILADLHDENGRVTLEGFYDGVPELPNSLRTQWDSLGFDAKAFLGGIGLSVPAGEKGRSGLEMIWSRPTAEINGMGGGYQGEGFKTVIPAEASAKVSFRLVFDQDPHKVRAAFRKHVLDRLPADCRATFKEHGSGTAITFPVEDPAFAKARAALTEEWGKPAVFIGGGGSIPVTSELKRALNMDVVLAGFAHEDDRFHSPNEKYDMQSFHKGIRSWVRVLAALAA